MKKYGNLFFQGLSVDVLMAYKSCHACGHDLQDCHCEYCGLDSAYYNGFITAHLTIEEIDNNFVVDLNDLHNEEGNFVMFDRGDEYSVKQGNKILFPKDFYQVQWEETEKVK